MAFVFDEAWINNGQLVVASETVKPPGQGLGKGADRVRHSAYIEGPLQVGKTGDFSSQEGTVVSFTLSIILSLFTFSNLD